MLNEMLALHPVLTPFIAAILAVILSGLLLVLLPLMGGRDSDSVYPSN